MHLAHRHLVRPPVILGPLAVDFLRAGPTLGCAHHDHRPQRPLLEPVFLGVGLDALNLLGDRVERVGHDLVHFFRFVPLDEIGRVAVAAEEMIELLMADAGQEAGVGDLIAVQMENRQDDAVGDRVQELVGMPGGRQRAGLRFAVADDGGHDQVWVVVSGSIGMGERIAQLAAFVNGSRGLRRHVAGNAAGERELLEQPLHALFVLRDVGIDLGVGPFQIGIGDEARTAVPRADDVDHVQVVFLDDAVQVHVEEVQSRRRPPVAEQARLDVLFRQRLFQQRVVVHIDLPDRQVVRRPPVGVHEFQFFLRQSTCHGVFLQRAGVYR